MKSDSIPRNAKVIDSKTGIIQTTENWGKPATVRLYRGFYSQGYRGNYQPIEHLFIESIIDNTECRAQQFTGKRVKTAYQVFENIKAAIQ